MEHSVYLNFLFEPCILQAFSILNFIFLYGSPYLAVELRLSVQYSPAGTSFVYLTSFPLLLYVIRLLLCSACYRVCRVKSYITVSIRLQSMCPNQSNGSPIRSHEHNFQFFAELVICIIFPFRVCSRSAVLADTVRFRWSCFAQRVARWCLSLCDSLYGQQK